MTAPQNFLWGTAISAHQSEGGNVSSDTWLQEHVKPTAFKEPSGDACDSLHRYSEDISLAASLGFNTHRFGIEWARIEPEPGAFSQAALDHYQRVLDKCDEHGLAPMVTYSHFTVPRWFAARGGFENPESPELFARFASTTAKAIGAQMDYASTFNEANILRLVQRMFGGAKRNERVTAMQAACAKACGSDQFSSILFGDLARMEPNLVKAHQLAMQAIKAEDDIPVGATLTMQDIQGEGDGDHAAKAADELYGPWLEAAKSSDFVGVQTYTRFRVGPNGPLGPPEGAEMTAARYEFYPAAIGGTIRFAAKHIGRPIIVTENGIATDDDSRRIAYIDGALDAVRACIADGIDVGGYIHWSLLDNFEWTAGYGQRFGLVEVDLKTFKRTPKASAAYLGQRARENRL